MKIKQRLVLLGKRKSIFVQSNSAGGYNFVDAKPFDDVHSRLDDSKSIPNRFQIDSKILENNLESVWNRAHNWNQFGIDLESLRDVGKIFLCLSI